MSDPIIFRIPVDEVGAFALALVDRAAVGYDDAWQAPGGKTLPDVAIADYDAGSTTWVCQVTTGALVATPNVDEGTRKATFCAVPAPTITVGEDSFKIDLGYFQDANAANGLTAYLFENRTKEAFVYFGADGDNPPRLIGRCRLTSGNIGGDAETDLEATATFPLSRAPDVEFGTPGNSRIVTGAGGASAPAVLDGTAVA